MYIEELEIDIFMHKVQEYENMDDDQKWNAEEPVMSPTVQKYFELGELFLDEDDEEDQQSLAQDIMSAPGDIFS